MREKLQALKEQALQDLETVTSLEELKNLKVQYLGKKGSLTEILRGMGALSLKKGQKSGRL